MISQHDFDVSIENRLIYLFNDDGDDGSISPKTAVRFIKNLDILESSSSEPITVKLITSYGGDWWSGLAIYSAIKNSPCYITAIGYGSVCSASTIILQAADTRLLVRHTDFMFHGGSVSLDQSALSAKATIRNSERGTKTMLDIYADRCQYGPFFSERGYSLAKVRGYLNTKMKNVGDVWLTCDEAVEMGFVDGII